MLTILNKHQIEYIYHNFMVFDFPPDELKPLPHLLRMVDEGLCTYYALMDGEEVLSYFGLCVKGGFALVDYLAVNPNKRGKGIGSKTLEMLKAAAGENSIIVECEEPRAAKSSDEEKLRQRRINFYLKANFRLTEVKATLFGVDYVLLCYPAAETKTRQGYETVYRAMLPAKMYEKNMIL